MSVVAYVSGLEFVNSTSADLVRQPETNCYVFETITDFHSHFHFCLNLEF